MKKFLDENFLLNNKAAEKLYHEFSKDLPIIDYHCHLPQSDIAVNRKFENLTKIWLDGDHYKWRAMRANGIPEEFITGNAPDKEKFRMWAKTTPETLRNPLYHWTHLELKRYFGIDSLLNEKTADEIYDTVSAKLQTEDFSVRSLMKKAKVELVCTTDDPIDNLADHQKIKDDNFSIKVLPTWRPDKAMAVENAEIYNAYLHSLEEASGVKIQQIDDLFSALKNRQDFFHKMGCRLSDHGIENFYAEEYSDKEIESIFKKIRSGADLTETEILKFKSAMLIFFAEQDHEKNWTQQFHIGAVRNNNSKMFALLGADKGYDSIGDFSVAKPMSKFFNKLASSNKLTKTIVYNLNPRDNYLIATMIYNFNDGSEQGKMQFGSGWWFLDQKEGMINQMNALSSLGLLSRFVGMLTDSRSFLSYPRHEYFRRILCNLVGTDMENGEIPYDFEMAGKLVSDVSYGNASRYFGF
ncbi:MAG: glucuronate isomerase [Bacteroidales bacterium]|nr:glucuronate isomerase [Bacteroidales bacterium]MCF8406103.1 glucuronate isomerase [Bacteroidales bacterium]